MSRDRKPSVNSTEPPVRPMDRARMLLDTPKAAKRSLNLSLRTSAIVAVTVGMGMAGLAFGDPALIPQIAPRSEIDIRVGRNKQSGRVEIYGAIGSRASVRRDKGQVVVRLPGQMQPDLGDIRANPPAGVKSVDLKSDARASELWLTIADGFETHFGREDGAVFVQIDPKALDNEKPDDGKSDGKIVVNLQDIAKTPPTSAAKPTDAADASRVNRAPSVPVVALDVASIDGGMDIFFPFEGPAAAAIFRRGDSVWVVFDQEVDLRLPGNLKDGMIVQDAQWTRNDGFTALRLKAPTAGSLSAVSEGLVWRVRVGGKPLDGHVAEVNVVRDDSSGVPGLNINLAGATRVAWIRDPSVGDRMAVVPARGPIKNLSTTRTTLEATLASTAQGAAIVHMTPDVKVNVDGDLIEISRPGGLTLSKSASGLSPSDAALAYKNALYPSLMNPDWSVTPPEGFLPRYNALQAAAADEGNLGSAAPTKARLALARFLVGQGLNYEAQGVLDLLVKTSPRGQDDPQVRGLRVLARMLTGRFEAATGDLASSQLIGDPASRLWSGYSEMKAGRYADAVKDFKFGLRALDQFPPEWRARIGSAYAFAALQQNDLVTAQAMITYAIGQAQTPLDKLGAYLVDAQIIEAQGDKARALKVYQAVARASDDGIATPAAMHAAVLAYDLKKATSAQTLAALDSLRFRWRGDNTELQLIGSMGQIYLSEGRYREALMVMKSGGQSFAGQPQATQIQASMNQTFRALFLGGMADGLQPIEALALFNDFKKDLTPIGADGDEMVRRIVRRLVDVDLLDQAAELLDYQVNHRLDGVARSSVAADLAAIYLMNHNPQKALQTLWNTRTTLLPKAVMAERRMLEARALNELNEPDKALDVLGSDTSPDADDVRADVYWNKQDYARAGAILERRLGDVWKKGGPLAPGDEGRLIRAAVAYSLQKDQPSLTRLSTRFGKFADTASAPDAVRVALAPLDGGTLNAKDFAASAAANDSFAGWVSGMKKKFRQKDDAAAKAATAAPPAKTA
ncbi:tetratricopeptide repeat protein [Asticcacaulis sp. 201]|uniref:tetratricopeptide repeat protein n=1 Tax=Asticcacaulis sp. 201 TaxID=3028787 RepID=UPI002916AEEA|nr:tetratricopeptide repeat protein [Asticcacaulis sp. 201]MDV6330546.1 tetratricopeptide repeat protein [Asticcacaulis sp. 201]